MGAFIERHGGKPRKIDDFKLIAEYADLVRDAALAGTVDEVARQIAETAATGIIQITLYPKSLDGQTIELVVVKVDLPVFHFSSLNFV